MALPHVISDRPDIQHNFDALDTRNAATVAALPTAPFDGQVVDYVADATNGVVWRLRYRAASASAYKWEFVGGSPLAAEVITEEPIAAAFNVFQDITTVGPSITAPLAGDYDLTSFCYGYSPAVAGNFVRAGVKIGAAATVGNTGGIGTIDSVAGYLALPGGIRATVAAADVLKMQYRSDTNVLARFGHRRLRAQPVRVG